MVRICIASGPVLPNIVVMAVAVTGTGGNDWYSKIEVTTVSIPLFDVVYKVVPVIVWRDKDDVEDSGTAVGVYVSQKVSICANAGST